MSDEQHEDTGHDSRVEDWFGQSVQRDEELADELIDEGLDEQEAERAFAERATGEDDQERRHGDTIDPDQGRSAYRDDVDRANADEASAERTARAPADDPESPGATIDDAEPAEPNEPG